MRMRVAVRVVTVVGMTVPVCVIMTMLMVAMAVFAIVGVRAETHFGARLRIFMSVIVRVPRSRCDALQLQHQFPLRP